MAMPNYDEFHASVEQLMMTNAGRPMSEVIDKITVAMMDAFVQGYEHGLLRAKNKNPQ